MPAAPSSPHAPETLPFGYRGDGLANRPLQPTSGAGRLIGTVVAPLAAGRQAVGRTENTDNQNTVTGARVLTEPNKNKELVRGWIAFANTGFLGGSFDQFIAASYIGHLGGMNMNRSELERFEREFAVAFPDTQHSVDDLIAENDLVVLRSTARATHRGDFQGIAPTGKSVEFTAIVIYRIQDGKIAESWGEVDFLRLMRQLRCAQPAL